VVAKMCVGNHECVWLGKAINGEQLGGPVRGPTSVPPKPIQRGRWHAYRLFRQCTDALGLLEDPLLGLAAMSTVDPRAVQWCGLLAGAETKVVLHDDERPQSPIG